MGTLAVGALANYTEIGLEKSLSSKTITKTTHMLSAYWAIAIYVPLQVYVSVWARSEVMLRRESDSHGLFSSGETSDNDCEVKSWAWNPISFNNVDESSCWLVSLLPLIIALMLFTCLTESQGLISPRNLTILHFWAASIVSRWKRLKSHCRVPQRWCRKKKTKKTFSSATILSVPSMWCYYASLHRRQASL